MHPIVLILLASIVIAAVLSLISLLRGQSEDEMSPDARVRRLLLIGLAFLLAINLAMAGFGWFVIQSSEGYRPGLPAHELEDVNARLSGVEARLQALESEVAEADQAPPVGDRIIPGIESTIVRRSPAGEALVVLPGGTGVAVSFCMARREAGQYWCEIRTPAGETGWVPRTLIDPPPALTGERGG